jgi:hypothetical protein
MADQETTQPPPRQRRSPGYPGIDLKTALERVLDLYRVDSKHAIPLKAAAEEWGYSAKSSSNLTVAAALKRFGLVRDVGSATQRQLVLTDEGRELAFLDQERDSARWRELVREAALRPKIHRQVMDYFEGALPDDRIMLRYLLFELGFHDEATARDFIKRLRATVEFAGVEHYAVREAPVAAGREDESEAPHSEPSSPAYIRTASTASPSDLAIERDLAGSVAAHLRGERDRTQVQIPYSHDRWATLHAAFPITEREWDAMIAMLQAMKPGLVRNESVGARDAAEPPAANRSVPDAASSA